MSRFRIFIFVQILIICVALVFGQVIKANMNKCGIEKVRTIMELDQMEIALGSIFADEAEDSQSFIDYAQQYVTHVEDAAIIAVIEPTGNIRPYYYSWKDEVVVKKVIRGDASLVNKKINIYDTSQVAVDKNFNENVAYYDVVNIMRPGNQYLAFFDPVELHPYMDEVNYRFSEAYFAYLKLESVKDGLDLDLQNIESKHLNEISDVEFLTSSNKTYQSMVKIKEAIIQKYLK
jgi:hypothetical protein